MNTISNLRKCSCCSWPTWDNGIKLTVKEVMSFSHDQTYYAPVGVCGDCKEEAEDSEMTVEQLIEFKAERAMESAYE